MSNQKKFETEPAITISVAADQVTQQSNGQPAKTFAEGLAAGLAQAAMSEATKADVAAIADGLSVTNAQLKAISPSLAATLRSHGFYEAAAALGGKPAPTTFMAKAAAKLDAPVTVKHVGVAVAATAVAIIGYDAIARRMDWRRPGIFSDKVVMDIPMVEAPKTKR